MDFAYISRELVDKGAELLVFPTMDATHWGVLQHRQHATLAPFRAVEHRRFLVRVASSGISLIIDPYGRTLARTGIGPGRAQVMTGEVGLSGARSFYTRWGYFLPHLCMAFTALLLALTAASLAWLHLVVLKLRADERRLEEVACPALVPSNQLGTASIH